MKLKFSSILEMSGTQHLVSEVSSRGKIRVHLAEGGNIVSESFLR